VFTLLIIFYDEHMNLLELVTAGNKSVADINLVLRTDITDT